MTSLLQDSFERRSCLTQQVKTFVFMLHSNRPPYFSPPLPFVSPFRPCLASEKTLTAPPNAPSNILNTWSRWKTVSSYDLWILVSRLLWGVGKLARRRSKECCFRDLSRRVSLYTTRAIDRLVGRPFSRSSSSCSDEGVRVGPGHLGRAFLDLACVVLGLSPPESHPSIA